MEELFIFSKNVQYLKIFFNGNPVAVQGFKNQDNTLSPLKPIEKLSVLQSFGEVSDFNLKISQRVGDKGFIGGLQTVYYLRSNEA